MSFVCSICGQQHDELITNWAFTLPDEVWAIPEPERFEKAKFTSDLCQFGDRYFIRCVLPVPIVGTDQEFGWGVWSEVEWPVFERYYALYDEDASGEPLHSGTLANDLPIYAGNFGTEVEIQFGRSSKRPTVFLPDDDVSSLATEQRSGIDSRRHHEILELLQGQ